MTPPPLGPVSPHDAASRAQQLLRRITRIVREGALASEVRDVIEEGHAWLLTQPPAEHADLRAAHLLLFRYTEMQSKTAEERHAHVDLQQTCHDLKEQLRAEQELAEAKYQELDRLRTDELEAAKAMKESLQERYEKMEKDWNGKYEVCLTECRRLIEELKDLKRSHNPLPHPPRSVEPRYYYLVDKSSSKTEPMVIVKDDSLDSVNALKIQIAGKEDMFRLSPVPPTLPIPPLADAFPALTDDAEDRDDEDGPVDKSGNNPYLLRSIQPIPIKSSLQRMPSSVSLLSRFDDPMSRSLPRSSLDVHMASCSSSPNVSMLHPVTREWQSDGISGSLNGSQEGGLGPHIANSRRPSVSPHGERRDQEGQHERWRAQLRDLLDDPSSPSPIRGADSKESGSRAVSDSTARCSVSDSMSSTITSSLTSSKPCLQRSNTISRASTAAMAAERARASAMNASPTSPYAASTKDRDMLPPSQSPMHLQSRPPYSRTMSTESLRGKTSTTTASGLTRSLWVQEQRV